MIGHVGISQEQQLKIPYGESNFKKVITQGYTYIDKTDYIARLEETGSHLACRNWPEYSRIS
jgi:hypothetical protein